MSTIFFSAAVCGFFPSALYGREPGSGGLPDDAVRITAARHQALLAAQAEGAEIVAGENGRPALRRPAATIEAKRQDAIRRVKREARRRILGIAPVWRQSNDNAAIALAAYQLAADDETHVDVREAIARRAVIDAIRAAGEALEDRIATMPAREFAGFDPRLDMHWTAR